MDKYQIGFIYDIAAYIKTLEMVKSLTAKMLTPDEVQTIFPACGSSNSAIELTIEELEKYSAYAAWTILRKVLNMNKKHQLFLRLFILFFTVSVSVTIIPYSSLYTLGLFGEIKSSTVTVDNNFVEELEKQVDTKSHKCKGINIINTWYELWCSIVCLIFIVYMGKLPRGDTIVTLKVRMDN